jgi:hypothetical protein
MARKKLTISTSNGQDSNLAQKAAAKAAANASEYEPMMVATAAEEPTQTLTRRNIAGTIQRTNRFSNIEDGLVPFRYSSASYGNSKSSIDIRDAVVLCQKCYYNFALFRNIIDLMTEFSVSPLVLQGGSQQSRDFFEALFKKVNLWDLQDKFFREYYRSGNVFIYRFDADAQPGDVRKMNQAFAALDMKESPYLSPNSLKVTPDELHIEPMRIPARYIILNPSDIQMMSTLNFAYGIYFKILTDFEIAQLRTPKSEEDIAVFKDLPPEIQKQIKTGSRTINIPLDPTKVSMVFYKKQDYEPFAVPMGYPVLEDINFKAELRKMDMAISRTMQQIILLVTTGAEPDKGGINPRHIESLRRLFANQSVGRVLIADYTTKAEFIIPKIAELLDPKKYETVNEDINIGLNNVFASSDKFANQQQKVELFISRLEQGQQAFLNNFLLPEMRRVAKSLKFKNYPTPSFEAIELKDNSTMNKIYARLMEIGILTPEQGYRALHTGVLPDPTLADEEQKDYMKKRDKGLYTPLIGGPKDPNETGRPEGSTGPKTVKKLSPIGTSASETQFSLRKVSDNLLVAQQLENAVMAHFKETHKVKRMSKLQKEVSQGVVELIMSNEEPSEWMTKVNDYCTNPEDTNNIRVLEVNKIATAHQLDNYLASVLLASKV